MIEKNCTVLYLDARELKKKTEKFAAVCIFALIEFTRLGAFSILPDIPEISVENQMVSTLSVWSD